MLLVALPAMIVLALVVAVFDGPPAVLISTVILGAVGGLVHSARDWDASDSSGDAKSPRHRVR